MNNLDDISVAIGKLYAQSDEATRHRMELMHKLDAIDAKQDEMRVVMHELAQSHHLLQERMAKAEVIVEDYSRMKQRGLGVVAFVGFIAAGSGAAIMKWFQI